MHFRCIKIRYSIEPKDRIYAKGYAFLSFVKDMSKNLSNKYGEIFLDSAKTSKADAIKTAPKRAIQKTAEATGDLIGKKIADKITSGSTELHSKKSTAENSKKSHSDYKLEEPKTRYISPEKRQQIIDDIRLV